MHNAVTTKARVYLWHKLQNSSRGAKTEKWCQTIREMKSMEIKQSGIWTKIEQNRQFKLERFNSDKIPTKSGATDFCMQLLLLFGFRSYIQTPCLWEWGRKGERVRTNDRKNENREKSRKTESRITIMRPIRTNSLSSFSTSILLFKFVCMCFLCSLLDFYQTFQLHCECVRLFPVYGNC